MDGKLVAWARAVKARERVKPNSTPPLWLFSDERRIADLPAAIRRLPKGLAGVVLRDGDRSIQRVREIARLCRQRRIALSVAGGSRVAAGVGCHLRRGIADRRRNGGFTTSSAHSLLELQRALHAGATVIFLSPVFPTMSHIGVPGMGTLRWARLAGPHLGRMAALGGIEGHTVRALPRGCRCIGAIGALS